MMILILYVVGVGKHFLVITTPPEINNNYILVYIVDSESQIWFDEFN